MERRITGFERDEADDWVARLDCGHARHVRHHPPLAERPWVETEAGRTEKLGTALDCVRCDRRELPEGFAEYRRTALFTEETLPRALRAEHETRSGTWALIHVERGRLRYRLHAPFHEEQELAPGRAGVVLPGVRHEVEPRGPVAFCVAFHRATGG